MNVYVESNFVLEQALEQEQCESCQELVRITNGGSIQLLIPAFSLAEPHIALLRKQNERSRLSTELQKHLRELGRSKPYRESFGNFSDLTAMLIKSGEGEQVGLQNAIDGMLKAAEVIPLNSDVFYQAKAMQRAFELSFQDSIVLASIVTHMQNTKPPASCFLNRNTKDFDDPFVRELLDGFGCKFFGRFDHGLRYVESYLRKTAQ